MQRAKVISTRGWPEAKGIAQLTAMVAGWQKPTVSRCGRSA
jgi:hypothetical protein